MITLNYPIKPVKKEQDNHFYLIHNFMNTLPCPTCKNEIQKLVNDNDLQLSLESRNTFIKYFWNIHNKVNKRLNKRPLSFKNFNKLYNSNVSFNLFKLIKSNKLKNIAIIILLVVIVILGILLIRK